MSFELSWQGHAQETFGTNFQLPGLDHPLQAALLRLTPAGSVLSVDFTHVLKSNIQAGGAASVDFSLTSRTRYLQFSAGESNGPDLQIAVHALSDVQCRGSR